MKNWKNWLLWLVFFGSFGFAGGSAFLLYVLVPYEHRLAMAGTSQEQIDSTLSVFVYGWCAFALLVSILYFRLTLAPRSRPRPAYIVAAISALAAVVMFATFLNTGASIIAERRSAKVEIANLVYGPYPELKDLQDLKRDGYDGVITLLHPSLPFERVLLTEELDNGKLAGIDVRSFPMLPWISDNQDAKAGISALISQPKKRYYVHCYLGQHRTNLVRQLAANVRPTEAQPLDTLLPVKLERGFLLTHDNRRIVLGPFPTDSEWVTAVQRHGVKEVVSVLNPANSEDMLWITKLREITRKEGLVLTEMPLDPTRPDPAEVQKIADYVRVRSYKVYVLGMLNANWTWALDKKLGGNGVRPVELAVRDRLDRGELLRVGQLYVLGPYPTEDEIKLLKKDGISEIVSLMDLKNPDDLPWIQQEKQWAKVNGFAFKHFSLELEKATPEQYQRIRDYLRTRQTKVYVHGFRTDKRVKTIYEDLVRLEAEKTATAGGTPPGS